MRIAWCVLALLAGATAWAQTSYALKNDKDAQAAVPYGKVTQKLWGETAKSDKPAQAWHMGKMTAPEMLAMGMLPVPLGGHEKAMAKPIPTEWPNAKLEQIPTTWPKLKLLLIDGGKKEPDGKK